MDPQLLDLMMRVQSGHATCMFAATQISNEQDRLLSLIEGAANRLESIRETDKSGLILDDDITRLRSVVLSEGYSKPDTDPGEGHRLLQPGETIQKGDEAFMGGMAGWGITSLAGRQVPEPLKKNPTYRRKTPHQCDNCRRLSQLAHWELPCPSATAGCTGTTIDHQGNSVISKQP